MRWKVAALAIDFARLVQKYGHDVRIISPRRVKAFLQGHKTDANDALAVAIAATQFGMVFSQIKADIVHEVSMQDLGVLLDFDTQETISNFQGKTD